MDGMESKQQVRIGDVVKSLDFVGVNDCYYVGLIVGISEMDSTFRAKAIKRVWQGQPDKKPLADFFTAPLPGHEFFDDLADEKGCEPRIQVLA
jgi:hypothetical protein